MKLDRLRVSELDEETKAQAVAVVPLGALEQHGSHLPMGTDYMIVGSIAERLEARLPNQVLLVPSVWLGHSDHHLEIGAISADVRTYMGMIKSIVRSLVTFGMRKILLLSGHGRNDIPAKAAMLELKNEFREVDDLFVLFASYWQFNQAVIDKETKEPFRSETGGHLGSVGHASDTETSLILYLDEECVDMAQAELCAGGPRSTVQSPGNGRSRRGFPVYLTTDALEWSKHGVNGTPAGGTADAGKRIVEGVTDELADFILAFMEW